MATPDVLSIVYADFWNMLNDYPDFSSTFLAGNQIRYDAGGNILRPTKLVEQVADYPKIEIKQTGFTTSMFNRDGTPTLDMENVDFVGNWIEVWNIEYLVKITNPQQQYTTETPTDIPGENYNLSVFLAAIRNAGPKLGLSYVTSFGPLATKREDAVVSDPTPGDMTQDKITIPLVCIFSGEGGVLVIPSQGE